MISATAALPVSYPTDPELLGRVLHCYKQNCRYLTGMTVSVTEGPDGDRHGDKHVAMRGLAELAIGESCYIDDTGHLNAVEANITYNQMLYYTIAKSVQERLGPFSTWTMDDYWRRQLPGILITKLVSRFRWPVDRSRFSGEFELRQVTRRRLAPASPPLMALDTAFRFWDERKGQADGEVTVAIVGS